MTHTVFTGLKKCLTCGSFPTQASDEHLPVGEERTADEIYAHKKFAQVTPSLRSNETRSRLAEIQLAETSNLPWIVREVDFGGSWGLLAIRLHFPTTTTKQEIGQRIPTRGYYIRIGSWWVVIWRHLELAPMLVIDLSCGLSWLVHESFPRDAVRTHHRSDTC